MTAAQQTTELPGSVARQALGAAPYSAFARVLFVWAKERRWMASHGNDKVSREAGQKDAR